MSQASESEPGSSAFAWGLWAALTAGAGAFVWQFGPNLPIWDDFAVVDFALGRRRVTLGWLWSLHNEHRIPLPKLLLLLLDRGVHDFRAGMALSVAALAGLSAGALAMAGRRAGGARVYDGLLPLVLLNLSHHANLLWSWQVQFVLSTAIAGGLILLIAARPGWPGPSRAAAAGVGLAALGLCGANGVALVPALAAWLLAGSAVAWASRRHGPALGMLAATIPGLAIVALYFSGDHGASHHPAAPGLIAVARTSLQFLALLFGVGATNAWPAAGLAALALIGSSALIVIWAALFGPVEGRPRALGLLCALAAMGSLVLGMGWGRAGSGEFVGLEPRYATLIAPLWLAAFFAWDLHSIPAVRRVLLTSLFAVNLVLLWPETRLGLDAGREKAAKAARFVRDVREGVPLHRLARRHTPFLFPSQDELARELSVLRDARVGVFAAIRPDPPFREVAMAVEPAHLTQARWEGGKARVTGVDAELHYVLPRAITIGGIRLKYSHANAAGSPARFRIRWSSTAGAAPAAGQSYSNWALPTGKDRIAMLWIADEVKEFWIQPDNQRCEFAVEGLTLLVP